MAREDDDVPGAPRVEAIWIKRFHGGPMDPVDEAELVTDHGIAGNADVKRRRQVTIISTEAWSRAETELGERVDPSARRANVLVSGIDLEDSRGRILVLGPCRVEILGETRPCPRMDEARPGLMAALDPEWRGGVFGRVVEGGGLSVGAAVGWGDDPAERSEWRDAAGRRPREGLADG